MTGPRGSGSDRSVTTAARAREVFAGSGFRKLFGARIASTFGDGLFQIAAVAVLLFENPSGNPAADLLIVSAIALIPFSVISPFVGVFIDRWERRKILLRVPLARAGLAALLPLAGMAGERSLPFYALVLVVLSANRFFLATVAAVLPQVVPEDDLLVANSISTTGGAVSNVAGQGVGSALASLLGANPAAAFAAGAFALAALAARRIPVHRGLEPAPGPILQELREVIDEMREGVRTVRTNARVSYGMRAIATVQVLVGGMTGVLTYYFIRVLGLDVGAAATLLAALAIGLGIGVVLVPTVARRVAQRESLISASLAIAAAGNVIAAVFLSKNALLVAAAVAGISYAFVKIPVDTIVQEEMADRIRGRAFAVYDMLFNIARVTGVAIIAALYAAGAASRPLVAAIAACFAVGALLLRRREEPMKFRKSKPSPATFEAGELVTLRSYAGARADEEPRVIVSGGREVPIDAIDWRAVVEDRGERSRVFVVRAGGQRLRLAHKEDGSWSIDRVMPMPGGPA